ncbi:MAG: cellulase family glycosylhydrolase [Gemmataceae bacterium]|nr:cellulase family glycosylhydrolase [Gemmataceae bacterium]
MSTNLFRRSQAVAIALLIAGGPLTPTRAQAPAEPLEWVRVSPDGRRFVLEKSKRPFVPWGFNYDHDEKGRLIEDYWDTEWARVEEDFREMKDLGANVVRIHLQFGKFMKARDQADPKALDRLGKLLALAEKTRLYLDLTGLGCYHKQDVPAWYDALSEEERWAAQARFWEAIAGRCKDSPAVFFYDLMNEPVVPGGKRKAGDWLGPPFGGKHFVQCITLDQKGRPRPEIAAAWTKQLAAAIRKHDKRHLITVGLVDWSLDRPGLTSGFVPDRIAAPLDLICVHIYPKKGEVDEALATLKGFAIGKPVVIEETFPLQCSVEEFARFMKASRQTAAGWIGFYWGQTPAELRRANTFPAAITLQWLEFFQKEAKAKQAK